MMVKHNVRLLTASFVLAAAVPATAVSAANILLIIGDDMGVETLRSYGLGENPPATPRLDEMAREGVRFNNFWSQPACSPTRATIMTGRYGFRTGIGAPVTALGPLPERPAVPDWALPNMTTGMGGGMAGEMAAGMGMGGVGLQSLPRYGLSVDEYTLPMAFNDNAELGYSTAAIGKWHLADSSNGWLDHPNLVGFDHFSGSITGGVESYFAWNKVIDGEVAGATGYAPTDKVDDAIAWIDEQGENPWFLWFAFNLPHGPLHLPPDDARTGTSDSNFPAMIEAMDAQIGRLLASLESEARENTYVIFMGDNGTPSGLVSAPFQAGRAKGTVYKGGVNVPFLVTGPGVQRDATSEALVNSVDLFATILEMAGIEPATTIPAEVTHDSISFLPTLSNPTATPRDWIFADEFFGGFAGVPTAYSAMRNERYKLLKFDGVEEFYDLQSDPYEHNNLLTGELSSEERSEYLALQEEIASLRGSETSRTR